MIPYFYSSDFFYHSILPSVINKKIQLNYISSLKTSLYLLSNLVTLYNISPLFNTIYLKGLKSQQNTLGLFIMELESLKFNEKGLIITNH